VPAFVPLAGRKGIRRCWRGGFVTVCAGNGSVTVRRYSSEVPALYSS
jgi:hypothetical protein